MALAPRIKVDVNATGPMRMLRGIDLAISNAGLSIFLAKDIVPYIVLRAQDRFRGEGDDVVGAWAPLKPATQKLRAANPAWPVGAEHPINVRTSELEDWVTGGTFDITPMGTGMQLNYPKKPSGKLADKVRTAQIGSAKPLAVPRPVLGLNEADLVFATSALFFHVENLAKKI